jgi:hypothetical protein
MTEEILEIKLHSNFYTSGFFVSSLKISIFYTVEEKGYVE